MDQAKSNKCFFFCDIIGYFLNAVFPNQHVSAKQLFECYI